MPRNKTTKKSASDMLILPTPTEIILDYQHPNDATALRPELVISLDWSKRAREGITPSWVRYLHLHGNFVDNKCSFPIDKLFTDPSLVVVGFILRPDRRHMRDVHASLLYYASPADVMAACGKQPKKSLVPFSELMIAHQSMDMWGVVSTSPEIIIPEVLGREAECQIL